jgi:hypothetical protein
VPWWGGSQGADDFAADVREAQIELLQRACALESEALAALAAQP